MLQYHTFDHILRKMAHIAIYISLRFCKIVGVALDFALPLRSVHWWVYQQLGNRPNSPTSHFSIMDPTWISECASNHLAQARNVTNSIFLLAIVPTPINCAHCTSTVHAHIWPGRDHRYYRSISVRRRLQMLGTGGYVLSRARVRSKFVNSTVKLVI